MAKYYVATEDSPLMNVPGLSLKFFEVELKEGVKANANTFYNIINNDAKSVKTGRVVSWSLIEE